MNDTIAWILGTICWMVAISLFIYMLWPVIGQAWAEPITIPQCSAIYVDHPVYSSLVNVDCYYI